MKRKHIRTIIICALVLLAAVAMVLKIDIEPPKQQTQSPAVSSAALEAEKEQAKPLENEIEETAKEKNTRIEEEQKENVAPETSAEGDRPLKETKGTDEKDTPAIPKNEETAAQKPLENLCTIEIRCDTVVDTSKLENEAVAPYVPKSGVILGTSKIEFTPGESVFDILLRATKERNIHMEFRDDNLYSGKYIEGINYLYEMDAGPLSGWMYKVNGKFPNYGCDAYKVKSGDAIVWMYTCDLGVDVGDNSTW